MIYAVNCMQGVLTLEAALCNPFAKQSLRRCMLDLQQEDVFLFLEKMVEAVLRPYPAQSAAAKVSVPMSL